MPIIRKIMDVGNSKVISLPRSWLEFYEKEAGEKINLVLMEVDKELKVLPYIPKENKTNKIKEAPNNE